MKTVAILFALLAATSLRAAAPSPEAMRAAAESYLARRPIPVIEKGFSIDDALRAQADFVRALEPKLGPVAGYKIGLVTKANQDRLGAAGPVHAVLLKSMLLPNGAKVPAQYGIRPACELDLGVFVKDASIMEAKSIHQLIAGLSDLVCFIELVDAIAATNQAMDASLLTALNVGARLGIIGERTSLTVELASAMPNLRMTLAHANGKVIAEVPRLGMQPLENIFLLIADLKKQGASLKAGDFISLGSPAAPQPIPLGEVVLRYSNLPVKDLSAHVAFEK